MKVGKNKKGGVMYTLQGLPMLCNYRSMQASGETKFAWSIFNDFFQSMDADGPAELLWYMLTVCMKADNEEMTAQQRSDLIFFYEYCSIFFSAAHLLQQKVGNALPAVMSPAGD